ncbi:MAG: MFS transporter [Ilumatobacteraceae bacterium]|nr:MFS transporter [Ilumatobacteraceae bacterium]
MRKRTLYLLQATTALGGMGYGVMFTVLDDFRDKYGITEAQLGLIVGVGFITGFLSQILFAPQADKGHAKKLVITGIIFEILGTLFMAFGHAFLPLILGRLLAGFGVGISEPALRRILILSDPERMGQNLGLIVSASVAGFTAGPIVSALTADTLGIAAPFLIVAVLLVPVAFGLFNLQFQEANSADAPTQRLAFDLLRIRPLAGAIVIGLALFAMIGTFDSVWSIMMDDMKAPTWVANVGISLFAFPMIFLAPRGGRLTQKVGPFKASIVGLSIGAVFLMLYGTLWSPYPMLAVGVAHGIVDGLTVTGGSTAVALVAPRERLASAQGLFGGLQTLTGGIAAVAAGTAYGTIGRATFIWCAGAMLLFIAIGAWLAKDSLHITGSDITADA